MGASLASWKDQQYEFHVPSLLLPQFPLWFLVPVHPISGTSDIKQIFPQNMYYRLMPISNIIFNRDFMSTVYKSY